MNLDKWVKGIKARVRNDKNCLVIITGDVRQGKSTLAKRLAAKLDDEFSAENVAFSGKQLRETAVHAAPHSVVYMDEAVDGGFSRDAMARANKHLNKFFIVWGERNLIGFILIPHLKDLDSGLARRAHWMIHVPYRGKAIVYRPYRGQFKGDTFWGPEGGLFSFPFDAIDAKADEVWAEILRRKSRMVQRVGESHDGSVDGPDVGPGPDEVEALLPAVKPLLVRHGLRLRPEEV